MVSIWDFSDFSVMRLSEIFAKFCKSIRKITFNFTAVSEPDLIRLLNLLPKLEEIAIDVSLCKPSKHPQNRLGSLKNVKSFICKVECSQLILEIPDGVLTTLSFHSSLHDAAPSKQLLQSILGNQKNIEDLNFDPENVDLEALKKFKLKKLRLVRNHHAIAILKDQPLLTSLNMQQSLTNDEFFEVTSLGHLSALTVDVKNIERELLEGLNCMNGLKELAIGINPITQGQMFNNIELEKLEKLTLTTTTNSKIEAIFAKLSSNYPNLKHLSVNYASTQDMQNFLGIINLNSLTIDMLSQSRVVPTDLILNENENLKTIQVKRGDECHASLLNFITKMSPNIQKLHLNNNFVKDVDTLIEILASCNRLSYLTINNQKQVLEVNAQFVKIIKDQGKNLKHFEICKVKADNTFNLDKLKSFFEVQFENVTIENGRLILTNCK